MFHESSIVHVARWNTVKGTKPGIVYDLSQNLLKKWPIVFWKKMFQNFFHFRLLYFINGDQKSKVKLIKTCVYWLFRFVPLCDLKREEAKLSLIFGFGRALLWSGTPYLEWFAHDCHTFSSKFLLFLSKNVQKLPNRILDIDLISLLPQG